MKKALIIGAAGFVGNYLIDHIQKNCIWSIVVTKMPQEKIEKTGIEIRDLNILEPERIKELLEDVRPDYIFHLAAQSSVGLSWKNPGLTVDVNIKGSLNVLDAIRDLDYQPRVLLIGSGEEYGYVKPGEVPIPEDNVLRPGNVYAATKACQNMLGKIYSQAYGMDVMMVRAFNHVGPSQAPLFVVADFCKQAAEIEKGLREPVIHVGNLSARRDFSDVRDVVRAYTLLMEHGAAGETYNVGSGKAIAIREILDIILAQAKVPIEVQVDQARLRPVDVPVIEADVSKLEACTGWKREIPLEQTIGETLEYWRRQG
ncbi:MAG TPA: GDP-mannose 4,6-dehydratase [Candidatus Ventrimonas merdavium]|nr:GDP-mannose 4,6-dehydratase [Candidatus Ventrimonas merdavium]